MSLAFGFDFDDTLSAEPVAFKAIMAALVEAGHSVYIISAFAEPNTEQKQGERIDDLGWICGGHYTHRILIHAGDGSGQEMLMAGWRKREVCQKYGIVMYFDDRIEWCDEVSKVTRSVWMVPR